MRALLLLGLGLALGACQADRAQRSGFGPVLRVCEAGQPCRDQPVATLATTPEDRRGVPPADPDLYRGESPEALREAATRGDARAAYLLGQVEEFGLGRPRRPGEAARWYAMAAEAGSPWAQFRLAALQSGRRRAELTAAAAQAGHPIAAYNLGMMYLNGNGMPRSLAEAARWLTIGAEGGVVEAQYNLGLLYMRGDGVGRELYRGLTWMRQAASGGHGPAQKAVGRIYMTGLDTMGQDLTEAKTWLTPVAARGDRDAQRWLAEIARAEREERDFQRYLQAREAETQALVAGAVLAAMLAPPPVVYVSRW